MSGVKWESCGLSIKINILIQFWGYVSRSQLFQLPVWSLHHRSIAPTAIHVKLWFPWFHFNRDAEKFNQFADRDTGDSKLSSMRPKVIKNKLTFLTFSAMPWYRVTSIRTQCGLCFLSADQSWQAWKVLFCRKARTFSRRKLFNHHHWKRALGWLSWS